jgi:hypothetical protein
MTGEKRLAALAYTLGVKDGALIVLRDHEGTLKTGQDIVREAVKQRRQRTSWLVQPLDDDGELINDWKEGK